MAKETSEKSTDFLIHNIYTKDVSFESPNSPDIFAKDWEPKVDFDLGMSSKNIEDDAWEVTLNVTVKVSLNKDDDKSSKENLIAYLVEVKQAGAFSIIGFDDEPRKEILAITAPEILYPYAREQIANLIIKGGFPILHLPPMNFGAMYYQHLEKQGHEKTTPSEDDEIKMNLAPHSENNKKH